MQKEIKRAQRKADKKKVKEQAAIANQIAGVERAVEHWWRCQGQESSPGHWLFYDVALRFCLSQRSWCQTVKAIGNSRVARAIWVKSAAKYLKLVYSVLRKKQEHISVPHSWWWKFWTWHEQLSCTLNDNICLTPVNWKFCSVFVLVYSSTSALWVWCDEQCLLRSYSFYTTSANTPRSESPNNLCTEWWFHVKFP